VPQPPPARTLRRGPDLTPSWRVLWTAPVDGVEALASDGERLYVATPDLVGAVDPDAGRALWSTELEGDGVTLAVGDGVVVHRSTAGTAAFDAATGTRVEVPDEPPAPAPPSEPEGATFENGDEGLAVVDPETGETVVSLPVEWPQFQPGPLLLAGDRAYTGLADGRLVCLTSSDEAAAAGPASEVLEGLSVLLTGVGRSLGSIEDDRHHRAAVVQWLVEDMAAADVEPDTAPVDVIAALDRAHAAVGTPEEPAAAEIADPMEQLSSVLGGLAALVAGDHTATDAYAAVLRRLVFDPPVDTPPSAMAWSTVASRAAQAAFASSLHVAVERAGVDPAALPPFTGSGEELSTAVARAVFADDASLRDPLTSALRAADGVEGWDGGAFAAVATGDWDTTVPTVSAEAGERLLVLYPQLLDTALAVLAVSVVLREALHDPASADARLVALRASGEQLLASLTSPNEPDHRR
jgi:hypothetical protein